MSDASQLGVTLRDVLESAPDALLLIDAERGILFANARATEIFGYPVDEMVGHGVERLLPSGRRERHARHRQAYFDRPHTRAMGLSSNLVARRRDGTEIPVDVSLSPIRRGGRVLVIAAIRDATEKRELVASLRESRERMSALVASMSDGLIAADDRGRITDVNPEAERLLGLCCADVVGRPLADVVRLRDARTLDPLDLPLDCRQPSVELTACLDEARLMSADGEDRHVSLRLGPVVGADQRGHGTVMVVRDIADRRELRRRAQVSEQLATLGALAAGVGHEINNPLTCAMGNADLVARRLARMERRPDEDAEAYAGRVAASLDSLRGSLGDVLDAFHRIETVVNDLRQFSRVEPTEGATARLGDVLRSAVRICSGELMRRARVESEFDPELEVRGGAARLGQVFINLLMNAAQALPEPRAPESLIRVRARADASGNALVSIEDNGVGIPAEQLERIFDPFFTTKPEGVGTGLGLAICDRIVADLGGRIDLRSEPGRGTTIEVRLPLDAGRDRLDPALPCRSPVPPHR